MASLLRAGLRQTPRLVAFSAAQRVVPAAATIAVSRLMPVQESLQSTSLKEITSKRYASHFSHEQPPHTLAFIEDRIMLVLRCFDKVDPGKLTVDSHFLNDLGLDSLDHVEVIMMMEEEFMFEFPDDDWERLYTPAAITQYVADRFDVFH